MDLFHQEKLLERHGSWGEKKIYRPKVQELRT
jgi:hypothetical protein